MQYASGFEIEQKEGFSLVRVFNPWQQSSNVEYQYLLGVDPLMIPDSLSELPFIKVPVKRAITFSTTHIAFIDTLGEAGSIVGVSGGKYAYNKRVRDSIDSGYTRDIGYDQNLNYEEIIARDPDVVFLYGVESNIAVIAQKLDDLGVTSVFCGDYLEVHPLGKTEWIKFFGQFYQKHDLAEKIFRDIDSSYNSISARFRKSVKKPDILSGLSWKNSWYIPGGRSYAARLINDAGGKYLWDDNPSEEAIPMDLESVFIKAVDADVWINPGNASTLNVLLESDERFGILPVYKKSRIYNNNKRIGAGGGNDYWESGVLRPDLILRDLQSVFYPDSIMDYDLTYYVKLK